MADFENKRISNHKGLDLGLGHMAHCSLALVDLYLHTEISFESEKLFVDGWPDGRTSFIKSTPLRSPLTIIYCSDVAMNI